MTTTTINLPHLRMSCKDIFFCLNYLLLQSYPGLAASSNGESLGQVTVYILDDWISFQLLNQQCQSTAENIWQWPVILIANKNNSNNDDELMLLTLLVALMLGWTSVGERVLPAPYNTIHTIQIYIAPKVLSIVGTAWQRTVLCTIGILIHHGDTVWMLNKRSDIERYPVAAPATADGLSLISILSCTQK